MDWNGPLTAKQFVLLFWGPVVAIAAVAGVYARAGGEEKAAAPKQPVVMTPASNPHDPSLQDPLARQRELKANVDAVKDLQRRMEQERNAHDPAAHGHPQAAAATPSSVSERK